MSGLAIFRGNQTPLELLQNGCPPKFLQLASFNGVSRCLIEALGNVSFDEPARSSPDNGYLLQCRMATTSRSEAV